ncbi:MAG: bifunctional riboflavin kinase/FAD synthetase [Bacteroidetes bacterium]|nr:MAG: bifunctional riboflavin kinase/FAD synthetase [Bacteroidota bacterium]
MKVYRSFNEFERLEKAIVTQGTFDGVHLGHQKILHQLKGIAKREGGETVLLTFFPHPRMVLQPDDNSLRLLETIEEKIEHLANEGLDHLLIIPFTKEFSRQNAEDFVRDVLIGKLGMHTMVIGYDHRFGKNREGSFEHLKELAPVYDFTVEEITAEDIDAVTISSTKIRKALQEGDLLTANTFLGYAYRASGVVVSGHKKGKEIGFPTANIEVPEYFKLVPGDGVYAVNAFWKGQVIGGMANIGKQPTFNNRQHAFEVHLFDFNEDLYGEALQVEFVARLRDEMRFNGIAELKEQLEKDKFAALKILNRS